LKCVALAGAWDDFAEGEDDEGVDETADPVLLSLAPQASRAPTNTIRDSRKTVFFIMIMNLSINLSTYV
jgi:hypothetical protein